MAVTSTIEEMKIRLDLTKGSATISNCNPKATSENLKTLGEEVGKLYAEDVEHVIKVETYNLTA